MSGSGLGAPGTMAAGSTVRNRATGPDFEDILVFTNGTVRHAERVLERLGVAHHFEAIYDIVAADYVPKPEMSVYRDSTNQPYLHLVDGGVSDNLGIRAVLDGLYSIESIPSAQSHFDLSRVVRVCIVVVNAPTATRCVRMWSGCP